MHLSKHKPILGWNQSCPVNNFEALDWLPGLSLHEYGGLK